jgi:hypothetical protein
MQILMNKLNSGMIVINLESNLLMQIQKVYSGKEYELSSSCLKQTIWVFVDKSFVILVKNFKYLIQMGKILQHKL